MPVQVKKVSNFGSLLKKHAADETVAPQDFSRLPGGITNGVAKLVGMSIGVYKNGALTGQQFFRAVGSVLEPKECVDTIKQLKINPTTKKPIIDPKTKKPASEIVKEQKHRVFGLQTSIMEPLCDTGAGEKAVSAERHVANMLNQIRLIGGEECTASLETSADPDAELKAIMETLVRGEEQPDGSFKKLTFKFDCTRPEPTIAYPRNDRAFERWYGAVEFSKNGDAVTAGVDESAPETGEDAPADETPADEAPADEATPAEEPAAEPAEAGEGDDLDAIAEVAEGGDVDACQRLTDLATEAGVPEDKVKKSRSWTEVVEMIRAAAPAEETATEGEPEAPVEPEPEAEPWKPAKGEEYLFKVIDPKTKKPAVEIVVDAKTKKKVTREKKPISVEVKMVYPKNETVDLLDPKSKIAYKGRAWTELLSAE